MRSIMFLLLLLVATVHPLMIAEDNFRLWLYNNIYGNYTIYIKRGENETRYSYPAEADVQLKYDGNFTLNNHLVNIVYQNGSVTPPPIIQKLFRGRPINRMEEVQVCYTFTTERITLKAVIGILALLFLASHGGKIRTTVGAIEKDLLRSQFARRFSRTRGPVDRGSATYATVEEEASL